jgi:predicted aspartyl protease
MIVGMFLVDSHIAEVLFDTGATHSFITASWVEAHNLSITTMSTPIQIDSAGGRIRADSICLNVSVEIRGIAFPANLIVMGTQGIDVILGMNWLDKRFGEGRGWLREVLAVTARYGSTAVVAEIGRSTCAGG